MPPRTYASQRRHSRLCALEAEIDSGKVDEIQILLVCQYRADLKFNVTGKIVINLQFSFQVNDSYDSNRPGDDESNKNDLSLINWIGYTF
jgi:hypothetical protein